MERTSSKRGLLMETTSYEQDLSEQASASTPVTENTQHPLASAPPTTICGASGSYGTSSMQTSQQRAEDIAVKDTSTIPPPISLPAPPPQYHINPADTDALLRRAQQLGLLDPLTSATLPQLHRALVGNPPSNLQGDGNVQLQQLPQNLLQLPNAQQQFDLEERSKASTYQYNLSTINERVSSMSDEDGIVPRNIRAPSAYNREASNKSTASVRNGFGTGYGGITSLTEPGTVQQVIGALQDGSQQQQQQQIRRVKSARITAH